MLLEQLVHKRKALPLIVHGGFLINEGERLLM